MRFKLRKFYVGIISLQAVLVIYLLYLHISRTPRMEIDMGAESASTVAEFDSEIGMVGDVGIGPVRKAKYIQLNKNKEVDREFGFEKLLHEEGNEWEIEKPYMNIFRRNFKCRITADSGKVQVEDAPGRPSPKDATLTGNVIIHILPENGSDIKESFIYLDDIVFISEKSQFSTAGPVKFVSDDAQMLGSGLELIYNDELDRLEFLRIVHLDSLRLKTSSQGSMFARTEQSAKSAAADDSQKTTALPKPGKQVTGQAEDEYYRCIFSKNVVIDAPEQLILADEVSINNIQRRKETEAQRDKGTEAQKGKANEQYEQQFVDIVITCDNGIIAVPVNSSRAADFQSDVVASDGKASKDFDDTGSRVRFIAQKIDYCASTGNTVAGGLSELTFYVNDTMASGAEEAVVPVKITAQEKASFLPASNQVVFEGDCLCTMVRADSGIKQKYTLSAPKITVDLSSDKQPGVSAMDIEHLTADGGLVKLAIVKRDSKSSDNTEGQTTFITERMDYSASTGDIVANGPSELTFYTNDVTGAEAEGVVVPVKITAQKRTRFLPASNRIVFEGDCLCTMVRADSDSRQKYTLSAPKITVDLSEDNQSSASAVDIKHITASGGVIRFASIKTAGGKSLGDTELKCLKLDYDTRQQMLVAAGPGIIKIDNSNISEPRAETAEIGLQKQLLSAAVPDIVEADNSDVSTYEAGPYKFSLRRRCYAFVQDFETLRYSLEANRIVADAKAQEMLIGYIPIVQGRYGQQVKITTSHIEALLYETATGRNELLTLSATGGITYEDEDNQFAGSELFYDADKSIIKAWGREFRPCLLNGVLVDAIEYDLKSGKINTEISGAGVLQMKR